MSVEHYDPPAATPGAVRCPTHVAVATRRDAGGFDWHCRLCGKDLVMVHGEGLR
mgnify:CR=1 FL=1